MACLPRPAVLDARRPAAYSPAPTEERAVNGTSTRRGVGRETRWLVETGATRTANGPGSLRTERGVASATDASRLRRRAPAIQGSADRRHGRPVGHEVRHRRKRVAPRKARPFVPETKGRLIPGAAIRSEASDNVDNRSAQPG
jgi:hypothetical protein